MKQKYITLLGLTRNEARIVRVLGHVPLALHEIEEKTHMSHASVVDSLGRLVKRGIVTQVYSDKRKTYTCEIETLFSDYSQKRSSSHKDVEIYDGKDALLSLISKELVGTGYPMWRSFAL